MYDFIVMLLVASIAIVIYGWFFRIKWWKLSFGIPAFVSAYFIEEYITTPENFLLIVLIIAPIIEETMKFVSTIYGKDVKTAIAVGLMFALMENAMYFNAFGFIFLSLFLVREFTDPVLHATTTSISVRLWKKSYLALPIAIGLHIGWNYYGYLTITNPYLIYIPTIIYGIILCIIALNDEKIGKIKIAPEGA